MKKLSLEYKLPLFSQIVDGKLRMDPINQAQMEHGRIYLIIGYMLRIVMKSKMELCLG